LAFIRAIPKELIDLHQVFFGDGIAMNPRRTAAGPVAARCSLVLDADEGELAVVRHVMDRRFAGVALAVEISALCERGGRKGKRDGSGQEHAVHSYILRPHR
jgi:hypothetical protein